MPDLRQYRIFISHAWRYDDDYNRLVKLLRDASLFQFANYSVPQHDPVIDPSKPSGRAKLLLALDGQIAPVHCVLVLSGMYAAYSDWINDEINLADRRGKPIVGIIPWGQQRTPMAIQQAAKEMVGWRTASIVAAIRKHALPRS